ncbi:MAG: hypothetical protein IPK82_22850 [Polyangiaceae bacterium]|nr:hypothetical protein [Polyangiaceae bacterium]
MWATFRPPFTCPPNLPIQPSPNLPNPFTPRTQITRRKRARRNAPS